MKKIEEWFGSVNIFGLAFVVAFAAMFTYIHHIETTYEIQCVGESEVEEILELKYRDAVILLANGMKVTVNQARLKVGDTHCYEHEQVKVED